MTSNELKNKALEKCFENMNTEQRIAVFNTNGPQLILAGAGSGKTTVLINRIVYMIFFGDAYHTDVVQEFSDTEKKFLENYISGKETDMKMLSDIIGYDTINPYNIFAITFTNKAAGELKDRIARRLGERGRLVTASTFHSACAKILRRDRNAERLGFKNSFTIYDADDSKIVIKVLMKEKGIDDKLLPYRDVMVAISHAKDNLIPPEKFLDDKKDCRINRLMAELYADYQRVLFENNAMDFDDLIFFTVKLFEEYPHVLEHYQDRYRYIMVDEYQDTSHAQYKFVSLLSAKYRNVCVVGDDDQSIYGFRGATIENILSFEDEFACANTVKLERNYRSTQHILTCANELIVNNKHRKGKNLWTSEGNGKKVKVHKCANEKDEALYVVKEMKNAVTKDMKYNDFVVLYRTNAQSNALEKALMDNHIPYRIFGGQKFYDRKEIRDVMAYFELINNHADLLRLHRIINVPRRGIGDTTVNALDNAVEKSGKDAIEVMKDAADYNGISSKAKKLAEFAEMIDDLTAFAASNPLDVFFDKLIEDTGYKAMLEGSGIEGEARLENVNELKSNIINYMRSDDDPTLAGFLQETALYTDLDTLDESQEYVSLMTVHTSKGLEFPVVFITGLENNLFPSIHALDEPLDMEEERRLMYVAITRAKKRLYLTYADERLLWGRTQYNSVSMFIKELPKANITGFGEKN